MYIYSLSVGGGHSSEPVFSSLSNACFSIVFPMIKGDFMHFFICFMQYLCILCNICVYYAMPILTVFFIDFNDILSILSAYGIHFCRFVRV